MGRSKIEKEWKDKLETREIAPSAQAWDRLDAMLSVAEAKQQKPVRRIGWIYYAAASVAILLLAIFLTQRPDAAENEIRVATSPSAPEKKQRDNVQEYKVVPETKIFAHPKLAPRNREAVAGVTKPSRQRNLVNHMAPADQVNEPAVVEASAQTAPTTNPGPGVDELLATAATSPARGENRVKVDAGTLLSQVDGELELTFREKVIRTVGKNYKNVKVALANRNQE